MRKVKEYQKMTEEDRLAEVSLENPPFCPFYRRTKVRNERRSIFINNEQQQQQQNKEVSNKHKQSHQIDIDIDRKITRESHKMRRCHLLKKDQVRRSDSSCKNNFNSKPLIAMFYLTIIWSLTFEGSLSSSSATAADQNRANNNNLPTVIVRGFLNYRTTVDGTVLLFTPDAGGSSSSSIQATSSGYLNPSTVAAHSSVAQSQLVMSSDLLEIKPTSSYQQAAAVAATMAPFETANDAWRPIQAATPPLRPIQTAFKPHHQAATSSLAAPIATGTWELNQQQQSSKQPETSFQRSASTDSLAQGSSPPSVQSDDVILAVSGNQEATAAAATTKAPELSHSITGGGRTSRPKRPSLGFNGQAIRAGGQRADRGRTGNQNEAQTYNTINGIRRPGLSTTPIPNAAPSTAAAATDGQEQTVANVTPHTRSFATGANKLRNRFKRPPISGSSNPNAQTSPTSSTTPTPTTLPPPVQVVPVNNSSNNNVTLLQSASENTEEAGSIVSAPPPPAVATLEIAASSSPVAASAETLSLEQQKPSSGQSQLDTQEAANMGNQAALQARLGDLFGPSSSSSSTSGSNVANQLQSPSVGSDEVLSLTGGSSSPNVADKLTGSVSSSESEARKLLSRSGDQPPSPDMSQESSHLLSGGLTGELQQGQLGNAPLSFDAFFQGDQPQQPEGSEHRPLHHAQTKDVSAGPVGAVAAAQVSSKKNHNERLTGWLDHHHSNKHIPRKQHHGKSDHEPGHLSQQLAANLNSLSPSFVSNIPNSLQPTPVQHPHLNSASAAAAEHSKSTTEQLDSSAAAHNATHSTNSTGNAEPEVLPMQTLTRTYSTVMTSTRTRLVPLQVKSSTAVHTITENYVITKVLTAYQTMPVGEFILPEPASTRSPFEMFETPVAENSNKAPVSGGEQPIMAPSSFGSPQVMAQQDQEQPISLQAEPKSANDWLHDFSNLNNNINNNQQQLQHNHLAALFEQQAAAQQQDANGLSSGFNGLSGFEPLDQLASSLDPGSLLNPETGQIIQIPDLNNPIVLAAAIQNPQLAAVILAAQQLKLKQQRQGNNQPVASNQQQQQPAVLPAQLIPLQPSYSTTFTTQVRPSTYTTRDTMYTTRLVSFKDGRTVRTRTVSEPGSVIEQVLTTTVTETQPVTITIRPTGMLTLPATNQLATAAPSLPSSASNHQATISNALIATQLANLLSRRQQQVQPSGLAALQQLLANNQPNGLNNLNRANQQQQAAKQFQPNFQNLLQSLQQQQQPLTSSPTPPIQQQQQQPQASQNRAAAPPAADKMMSQPQPTPPLPPTQPYVTTITNLQVRTYTVHNAFKTIFRTITSTQLLTSTIFPAGMTRSPMG